MSSRHVIFVSAVSSEFHRCPPEKRHAFQSYRDVLKAAFRVLAPHYEVIVQEDLVQGTGDLLETLDREIARSLIVVHLVGELAGWRPEPPCLRSLHARHPDLLASAPELRAALGDETQISYTQWEAYLAFHHGGHRLIFEAEAGVPRSPVFATDESERASQERHRARLAATGSHRGPFADQGDVARKTMRSFLHFRVDPRVDALEPAQEALDDAWAHQEDIVRELTAAIRKPDPRAVPVTDPANVAAFVAAVRACAEKWQVNLATVVAIAARHMEQIRAAAEARPAPDMLYAQALAELALGDFTAARHTARRAADFALRLREEQPVNADAHCEAAMNALLLLHDAANGAHDTSAAIAALEEAGALIDKERDPLFWAEVHEPLAQFLLIHAHYDRADDLISDILDIREARQGEDHPDLAHTLLLWSRLLHATANYRGMEGVTARAGRIFAAQTPPDLLGISVAMGRQGTALEGQNQLGEAEPLYRRALAMDEDIFGKDHPNVAGSLNDLALLLKNTNHLTDAEPLYRRALAIYEESYCTGHPHIATTLGNLAALLFATNRPMEAEPLFRRALAINEANLGTDHPNVSRDLNNLAALLIENSRFTEAEPLIRRALEICETKLGKNHPSVASALGFLADILQATNRVPEAEPIMRRALAIDEQSYGSEHPNVAADLNNLAHLLKATNRLAEAEPLMRRAVVIFAKFTIANRHEHPNAQAMMQIYLNLLEQSGLTEDQARERLRSAVREGGVTPRG